MMTLATPAKSKKIKEKSTNTSNRNEFCVMFHIVVSSKREEDEVENFNKSLLFTLTTFDSSSTI